MGNTRTRSVIVACAAIACLIGALLTASSPSSNTAYGASNTGTLPFAVNGPITLVVTGANTTQDTVAARSFYTPAMPGTGIPEEWSTELSIQPAYRTSVIEVVAWATSSYHGIDVSLGEQQLVQWKAKSYDNDEDNTALPSDVMFPILPGTISFQVIKVRGHDQLIPNYKGYALHLLCANAWNNVTGDRFQSNTTGWSAGGYISSGYGMDSHVNGSVVTTASGFDIYGAPYVDFQTLTQPAIVGGVQQSESSVRLNTCQTS